MYGQKLYNKMKKGFDFEPVIKLALREKWFKTKEEAEDKLDAFLQWFSLIPTSRPNGLAYAMLISPVDSVFHAFLLNTKLYREFCGKYAGKYVDHSPENDSRNPKFGPSVKYTINLLEKNFGDNLHPSLAEWKNQLKNGSWELSCTP